MDRRNFVKNSVAASVALAGGSAGIQAAESATVPSGKMSAPFKMKFAPHFGMFKNSAGDDLIDQLKFMHEMGFRALEDNGMKGKSVEVQESIASEMGRLGMDMGVFVAHTISWREPGLVNPETHDQFVAEIKESVEVGKRVNATWMTVVPGHVDLRMDYGIPDFQRDRSA